VHTELIDEVQVLSSLVIENTCPVTTCDIWIATRFCVTESF
jgi:hypothetical protein